MNWIFDIFSNGGVKKEAELTDKQTEFERKVEANDWIKDTMDIDEAELIKEAAYEVGDTCEDTINKDYKLALSGLSDYNLAEMIAELKCSHDLLATLDFNEEKEKALKSISSNRKSAESKLLTLIGEHTLVDWKEAFAKFEEVDVVHPKDKDLYEQMPSGKWRKKTKFSPVSDKEKVEQMAGVGKEEEKGALAKDASLKTANHLKPVEQVQTADEARQIAIDWQHEQSNQSSSWGDVAEHGQYFQQLAQKFPELADEFAENGIAGKESSVKTADDLSEVLPSEPTMEAPELGLETPALDMPLAETPLIEDAKPKLDDKITTKIDEKIEEKAEDIAVKIEEKIEEHTDEMAEKIEHKIEEKIDEAFNKAPGAVTTELPVAKKDESKKDDKKEDKKEEPKEDKKEDKKDDKKKDDKDEDKKDDKKDDKEEKSENPFAKEASHGEGDCPRCGTNSKPGKEMCDTCKKNIKDDKEASLKVKSFRAGDKGFYHGKPATIKDMYLNTFSGDATMEIECEGKVVHISGKELKNLNNEPLMEGMENQVAPAAPATEIQKKEDAPEIVSKASRAEVIKKFALLSVHAEIDSPWKKITNDKGEEIIARVAPTLREKKSREKNKKVDIRSKENI